MPEIIAPNFKTRLHAVLEFDGHVTTAAKLRALVACGISQSTARRYLTNDSIAGGGLSGAVGWKLSVGLDVSLAWLAFGELDLHPEMPERWAAVAGKGKELKILKSFQSLPGRLKPKFIRMMIRMLNEDGKVSRLLKMHDQGQISSYQLLDAM